MPHLMLPRTWPGGFRRTLSASVVSFAPGKATEVSDDEYAQLIENGDVGKALLPAIVDEKGRPKVDQETLDTIRGVARPVEADAEAGEIDPDAEPAMGEPSAEQTGRRRRRRNR